MSENEKSEQVEESKPTEKPENVIPKNEDVKWRIVNQTGRGQRPLAGPARPETMKARYAELCKAGIPGSVILLDEKNNIEAQHSSFADAKLRRGRDEEGKPYDPTLVGRGHEPLDLSTIADKIKAMPETDPDDPEVQEAEKASASQTITGDGNVQVGGSLRSAVDAALESKRLENEESLFAAQQKTYEPPKVEKLPPPPPPAPSPRAASAPPPPKMPPPRSERMKGQPCSGGFLVRLISATNSFNRYRAQMHASKNRIERRDKRFVLEVLLRVAFGAPLCESTIHAAYSDAEDATRI